ncbi:MAG: ROK family protein [Reichenbachiella sp.]
MIRWGIDLGGTKIEGVVIDTNSKNKVLARIRIPTESEKGYKHVLNQIKELLDLLSTQTHLIPTKVGIGTPGSIHPETGLLKGSNSEHLNNKPILQDLIELLNIEIRIANDANCFALAEAMMGVVQDECPSAKVVFGVIIGTGVGGGLVVHGQIINGANGISGEWGHNFLDESGGSCYCGKTGCVETIIAGPALEKYYSILSGETRNLHEINVRRDNDVNAEKTITRLINNFGIAISTIINMIDPDAIIIGGGVGNIDLLYTKGVDAIKKHVFNPDCKTMILKPKLGDSAGVYGAAFL